MGKTKFQSAVDRFEEAAVALSWKGSLDPGEHRGVELEYDNARRELMAFGGGGDTIRQPSEYADDWPEGMAVERKWGSNYWRPGKIIGFTARRIRVRLTDQLGGITCALPNALRKALHE